MRSTALSYAYGLARARDLAQATHHVVAVVGDGALTGGLAYEALSNIGAHGTRVIIVLNDNGRSYAPTVSSLTTAGRPDEGCRCACRLFRRVGDRVRGAGGRARPHGAGRGARRGWRDGRDRWSSMCTPRRGAATRRPRATTRNGSTTSGRSTRLTGVARADVRPLRASPRPSVPHWCGRRRCTPS